MNARLKIVLAGAIVGFIGAVGIYFEPEEPYKHFIVAAGTLSGVVLALLIMTVVDSKTAVLPALGAGAGLGLHGSTSRRPPDSVAPPSAIGSATNGY